MTESTHTVCSTSNCDNRATHDSGGQLVCGTCLHGMFTLPEPRLMDEAAREDARKLVSVWCENAMPAGWTLARPGRIDVETDGPDLAIEVHPGRTLVRVGRAMVRISAVEAAIASVTAGRSPGLVWALEAALDDGDALRGVIARAIEASNSIADRDAEDAIQEMLQHLLEAEPEGHDDRIEWARMEGANAMLEVIQREGYGARGIADNRDALRRTVAELAVAATMPRKPEPEFEVALLQREVEQLRAQLAEQQQAAHARADRLGAEWRAEVSRVQGLLTSATRERDVLRSRVEVDENDLDESGFFEDDGVRLTDPHPKILAWMAANGFQFLEHDEQDGRPRGIWRGNLLVRHGAPNADEGVVNDLASSLGRPPLDVLAEISAMVIE